MKATMALSGISALSVASRSLLLPASGRIGFTVIVFQMLLWQAVVVNFLAAAQTSSTGATVARNWYRSRPS